MDAMKTIVDYVLHTSAGFNDKPFCDADAIALSQLSYFEMPPMVHLPGPPPAYPGNRPVG